MAKYTKGKTFKKGKKTVMYIYRNGKKGTRKLVSVHHKLSRSDSWAVAKAVIDFKVKRSSRGRTRR